MSFQPKISVTKIVIAAYYRSGSTLLSGLLTLRNDIFYICEPYCAIYSHWYGAKTYHEVLYSNNGFSRYVYHDQCKFARKEKTNINLYA